MNIFGEFFIAIRSYFSAIEFINKHSLWKYLFLPAVFNLIAFLIVGYLAWIYSGDLIEYLILKMGFTDDPGIWKTIVQVIVAIAVRGLVFLLYFKLYRYIVLILFAPILAFISELVQERITGVKRPFQFGQFIHDVLRGAGIALRNLFVEITIYLLILVLAYFLPPLSPFVPLLMFVVGGYFFGFSMMDYRNEYYFLSAKESRKLIWNHLGITMGNGMVFYLILLIPLFGVLFAPTLAVIAAGLSLNKVIPVENKKGEPDGPPLIMKS